MRLTSFIKSASQATWLTAIATATLSCAFILVHYRSEAPQNSLPSTPQATRQVLGPALPLTLEHPLSALSSDDKLASEANGAWEPPATLKPATAPVKKVKKGTRKLASKKTLSIKVAKKTPKTLKVIESFSSEESAIEKFDIENADEPSVKKVPSVEQPAEISSALSDLIDHSFDLPSLTDDYQSDWQISAAQNDDTDLDDRIPVVPSYTMVLGSFQKETFADLKATLKALKDATPDTIALPPADDLNEPKSIASKEPSEEAGVDVAAATPDASVENLPSAAAGAPLDATKDFEVLAKAGKLVGEPNHQLAEPTPTPAREKHAEVKPEEATTPAPDPIEEAATLSEPQLVAKNENTASAEATTQPELVKPQNVTTLSEKSLPTQSAPTQGPQLVTPSVVIPPVAQLTNPKVTKSENTVIKPEPELVKPPVGSQALVALNEPGFHSSQRKPGNQDWVNNTQNDVGTITGTFDVDSNLMNWMKEKKGHIELHLEPSERDDRTNQDLISVASFSPASQSDSFEIPTTPLRGGGLYNLIARVYQEGNQAPLASIPYKERVSFGYNANIAMNVDWKDFTHYYHYASQSASSNRVVSLTLFEGGSGETKNIPRLANAKVRVIGFPELGTLVSNSRGNIRIPNVFSRSEFLLDIHPTENYYPAQKIVPVFNRDVYDVALAISKDKVDAMKFWTHQPQDASKGILMGKIDDPETRAPKEGETVNVSYEKNHALYFNVLPDPSLTATSSLGLFAYLNLIPSWRTVTRTAAMAAPFLTHIKAGYAQWFEPGRAGTKILTGRVYDKFNGIRPLSQVRLVGQKDWATETDSNGDFSLKVDLSSGVIPIEIESPGYAKVWTMWAHDPTETIGRRRVFELPLNLIKENALSNSKVHALDDKAGNIFGAAEPFVFEGHTGCNSIRLYDEDDHLVNNDFGPFPWGEENPDISHGLCLTADNSRWAYYNLKPGLYVSKYVDQAGVAFMGHVLFVGDKGSERVTLAIN